MPGYTAAAAAKTQQTLQHAGRSAKTAAEMSWRHVARKHPRDVLYNMSRTFLIVIMVLLLVCTPIDILPQSFSSGQFWNSIIVIVAMSIILLWAIVLHLIRRVTVNRWMAALPRTHQLGRRDIGKKLRQRIEAAQLRCRELYADQRDFSLVQHPGLQNPEVRGHVWSDVLDVGVPFWKLADMLPIFIEDYCTLVLPEFVRPKGASLREYLEAALYGQLLVPDARPYVEKFLGMYEQLRYSGRNVSQETLFDLMTAFSNILNRFQMPEGDPQSADARRADDSSPRYENESPRYENESPRYDDDGGPLSLVPSEVVESSQSSYSSSDDSVRIHPTRTQDSWVSHTSLGSSSFSHGAGMRLRERLSRRGSSILSLLGSSSAEPVPGMPQRPPFLEDAEHHLMPPRESERRMPPTVRHQPSAGSTLSVLR